MHGRAALGAESGRPIARRGDPSRSSLYEFPGNGCVRAQGFTLHAGVRIPAEDREALERLSRYLLRPPLSNERLSLTDEGRIAVQLKTPWSDGTTHFLYEPMEFLERLAALIPPPRAHLVVDHGVLAPCAALRSDVVVWREHEPNSEQAVDSEQAPGASRPVGESVPEQSARDAASPRPRNYSWSELMKRVFSIDVLVCPCGGPRSPIAVITEPSVIERILDAVGIPYRPTVAGCARAPPEPVVDPIEDSPEPDPSDEPRFVPDAG